MSFVPLISPTGLDYLRIVYTRFLNQTLFICHAVVTSSFSQLRTMGIAASYNLSKRIAYMLEGRLKLGLKTLSVFQFLVKIYVLKTELQITETNIMKILLCMS